MTFPKGVQCFRKNLGEFGDFYGCLFSRVAVFLALPCFSMISHVFPCFSVVAPAFLALSALLFCVCLAFPCFHCFFMNVFFTFPAPVLAFLLYVPSSCLLVAY